MKQLLTLLLAGLLLAGCRPPDVLVCGPMPVVTPTTNPPTTNPTTPTSSSNITLSAFLAKYRPPLQRLRFLIGQSQPIRTAGGAALSVAGVRFLYDNNTVATDSAALFLREAYRVPDMVLSELPTTDQGGALLISGGEFFMLATTPRGAQLRVLPTPASSTLPVWQSPVPAGQDNTPPGLWQMAAPASGWLPTGTSAAVQATQQGPAYVVSMPIDSLYRYNAIHQLWSAYQGATPVSVNVAVPAGPDTRVYLRPVSLNGLKRANATTASSSSSSTWYSASLPAGTGVTAIVLQSINGQLYVGSQTVTVQSGLLVTPTLKAVSEADALAFVRAL